MLNNLKEKIDIKTVLIVILSISVILLSLGISILIMRNINGDNTDKNTTTIVDKDAKHYGTVTRIEAGKLYFTTEDGVEESVDTNNNRIVVGDKIEYEVKDDKVKAYWAIRDEKGKAHYMQIYEYHETNTTTGSKTTEVTTSQVTNAPKLSADEEVLSFIKQENNNYSSLNTEDAKKKAKEYFVSLVDFIFYDKEIKGHTFKELSASAKAKTIYYTLKIDSIIDKNIPGYKNTLGDSYKNAKNQLIAKYTDLSIDVCANNAELCSDLKRDTSDLKNSLNITLSIIKDVYNEIIKPAGTSGIKKLQDWYEVWKNA